MHIGVILHQMIQLFFIMSVGYLINRLGIIDADFNKKLTKLLLNVTLPAMILSSVSGGDLSRDMLVVGQVFVISLLIYIILPFLGIVVVKLIRPPRNQMGIYMFMTTYANVGFMGIPIMQAVYGSTGVFYAAILNIVFNISSFTCGVVQINYQKSGVEAGFKLKQLLNPGIIGGLVAVVVYLTDITLPADLQGIINSVGCITTPMAMILIGSTLATMDIKDVFTDFRVYVFTVIRQVIVPLLVYWLFSLFIHDQTLLGFAAVMMMMPVANSAVMFATLYGGDEKLAARTVFITTLVSVATVPALLYVLFGV